MPIVHLHGLAISGDYLMPTARRLAGGHPTVVPDLPGYGRSPRREDVLGIPDLGEAVVAVLDALEIGRAVLVGNSMGCSTALEVAHLAPERVHGLVLVSPSGEVHRQPLLCALARLAQDGLREPPTLVPVAVRDYLTFGTLNGLRLFRQVASYPSLERLLRTPVPTLLVFGRRDPMMPSPARVRELARLAPEHVTVALVEQSAHAVNFSHPHELAGAIERWLDGALGGRHVPDGVRVVIPRGGPSGDSWATRP